MTNPNHDRTNTLTAAVVDLRAEIEAQGRAIARLEDQLRKLNRRDDDSVPKANEALQRELAGMLTNNGNIRILLTELAKTARAPVAR